MRRNLRERVSTLAPFLTFDPDPYIVVGDDGRLWWMMDAFTTSDNYPYSRHYRLGRTAVNYIRNSVKVVVNAYDGSTSFYVFDDGRSADRGVSGDLSDALQGCVGHARRSPHGTCAIPSCCSSCRPPSTACIT